MARQGVAWNKEKTKSVVLSKLKEFTISDRIVGLTKPEGALSAVYDYEVRGWFNQENSFMFGSFTTNEEAVAFLESIHKMF